MSHMSHKLPWDGLNHSLVLDQHDPNRERTGLLLKVKDSDGGAAAWKQIQHFARCVETQVEEFRATDKWTDVPDEAERGRFDLTTWGNFANRWCLPESTSVLCGYIELNMLLLDEAKWRPLLTLRNGALSLCRGEQVPCARESPPRPRKTRSHICTRFLTSAHCSALRPCKPPASHPARCETCFHVCPTQNPRIRDSNPHPPATQRHIRP